MKNTKQLSAIFALLGAILILGTVALSFLSLDAPARLVGSSDDAEQRSQAFMDAVCQADYAAAGNMLLGQPQLDSAQEASSALSALLWDTYTGSLSYAFTGECYASDSGLSRNVQITALDISRVMTLLEERSEALLEQHVEAASSDMVYDENNNYREDFVMEVLRDGVSAILKEGDFSTSREITLHMTFADGQWWILPEQALVNILSGGMGK